MSKKILWLVLAVVMVFVLAIGYLALAIFSDIRKDPYKYTEEEHIEKISKRVKKQFPERGDFSVYPLYDEQDKVEHYIVEFDSGYFMFIMLCKALFFPIPGAPSSIYSIMTRDYPWRRYTYKSGIEFEDNDDVRNYETDEKGDFIYRYTSPFQEAGITNEKRYLLERGVLAVKRGDRFFNLISMDYIRPNEMQPAMFIRGIPAKRFDL